MNILHDLLQLNAKDTFFLLLPYIVTAATVFLIVFIPCKIRLKKKKKLISDLSKTIHDLSVANEGWVAAKVEWTKKETSLNKSIEEHIEHIRLLQKRAGELNSTIYNLEKQVQSELDTITEQDRFLKEFGNKLITSDLKIAELTKKLELCSQKKISKKQKPSRKRAKR